MICLFEYWKQTKIYKWDPIKLKSLFAKERNPETKQKYSPRMEENICKWCDWQWINLQNLQTVHQAEYQTNKQTNQIKKWEELSRHFSKEDIQVTKKRCSTLQLLEKCKSKLQWNITSHQSEWPSSKNLQTVNAGEGVEKTVSPYYWWKCKLVQPLWKTVWRFL